jgi:hypothetical protein
MIETEPATSSRRFKRSGLDPRKHSESKERDQKGGAGTAGAANARPMITPFRGASVGPT